jgi:twitching motility protein PilT
MDLNKLLEHAVRGGASDLHLKVGSPPIMRIDGELHPMSDAKRLMQEDTIAMAFGMMTAHQKQVFKDQHEIDLAYAVPGLGRFRCNVFQQRGTVGMVFRVIPIRIPSIRELYLPPVLEKLALEPRGLILVTGTTGSGKSTTLAAMIDKINTEKNAHIVTIEDPIEYVHRHKKCIVNQREVHSDTKSFSAALRHILRQDPDIVLIGEMRDLETIEAALVTSETGHLTFATLHTNSCVETINRIIDVFPPYQQQQIRTQLSFVLEGVLAQQLIPRIGGQGRALAMEVMIPNPAIRNLIREDKIQQIYSLMQVGQAKHGMQTMNQALLSLVDRHFIALESAIERSHNPEELRQMLSTSGVGRKERPTRLA